MRHRRGGLSKISYKHAMIQGLRKFLESIEAMREIKTIIPGRIKRVKVHKPFAIKVQYPTSNDIKCIVSSGSSVQEVFIVTDQPEELTTKLQAPKLNHY